MMVWCAPEATSPLQCGYSVLDLNRMTCSLGSRSSLCSLTLAIAHGYSSIVVMTHQMPLGFQLLIGWNRVD